MDRATNTTTTTCQHAADCPMYGVFTLSGTLDHWKRRYCASDFESCERFKRSERNEPVPNNLLPNGHLLRKK